MSREYKADEYEINRLKSKLQTGSDKIIDGHRSTKNSVESKLNSVLSEYGDCSSISSSVRAIRALLADADGDVRQMESDIDDILSGLEFTIRSTRESQQEINSIIGRLDMPTFDTLDVGGGTSYTNTNSVMLKTSNDLTNDFLASSMIGGVLPVVLAAGDGVKTPSLLEQSTNITPDINSADAAKEYLDEIERKRKLKEIAEEKYGDINSQEDAKEYLDEIERKRKLKEKYGDLEKQENLTETQEQSQDIDWFTGIGISSAEVDTLDNYVNFKQSGFKIKQVANQYICIQGDYSGRANVPGVISIKQNWYRVGSKEFNKSILSIYTENGMFSNKITPKNYLSNLPKAAKIEFKIDGDTLVKNVSTGTGSFLKDTYSFSNKSAFGKVGLTATYMGMASGVFNQIQDNKDEEKKSDIHADIATEVFLDVGCMAAGTVGTKIGGTIGTALGPVGTAAGAALGFVVGIGASLLYSAVFDTDSNKEDISEWIEEKIDGFYGEEDM